MTNEILPIQNNDLVVSDFDDEDMPKARHEITKVIDTYLSRIDDYRSAFSLAVPYIAKVKNKEYERVKTKIKSFSEEEINGQWHLVAKGPHAASELQNALQTSTRLVESKTIESLIKSLFIGIFSEYDSFVGHLLKAIYKKNEGLLKGISREISFTELLNFPNIDAVKFDMLDKEIESLRRESYISQFLELERKFGIQTLKGFPEWPEFVEMSQRRNLFTHNDGHVSQQYLNVCKKEKVKFEKELNVGEKLEIGIEYYFRTIFVLGKVGFMLAHTLWRKSEPENIAIASAEMNDSIYLLMTYEKWKSAAEYGLFGLAEPQIKGVDDITKKIRIINTSLALKKCKRYPEALELIAGADWSACLREFRLAIAVIKDEIEEATKIMLEIGKSGEILHQLSYHRWPLFKDLRDNKEFQDAYEKIYGVTYLQKVSEEAQKRTEEIDSTNIPVEKKSRKVIEIKTRKTQKKSKSKVSKIK